MVLPTTPPVASNVCCTKANIRKSNHVWIIHDYRRVHDRRNVQVKSLPFSADDDEFKWHLILHPSGTNRFDSSFISIYLYADNPSSRAQLCPIIGNVKVSLIDAENQLKKTQDGEFTLENLNSSFCIAFDTFVNKDYLFDEANQLLPQDRLTIVCDLSYYKETDIVNIPGPSLSTLLVKSAKCQSESAWSEDIKTLFKDKEFADVTLRINGKIFPAHKSILVARSSVFKAMLRTDMIEKKTNCIEINDIDESVFIEMLRYMYTGKPRKLKTLSFKLFEAADKYDLKKLKIICEAELLKNVSKENAVHVLILADRHNAKDLKTEIMQYIKVNSNVTNILTEEVRKELITLYPSLFLEVLDALNKVSFG